MASGSAAPTGLEKHDGVDGPKNKKGRPFGSGTTNAKRRELRKEKQ